MTAEEIFKEVLNSPELQKKFGIPKSILENEDFNSKSNYQVIEIIKTIINGQENIRDKNAIFQNIQKQIMKL